MKMSFAAWAVALGLVAFPTAGGAASSDPSSGFAVPREEIVRDIKTIGVMPLVVADIVPDPDSVASRYEAEVLERLAKAGFNVVPPSAMREIRERLRNTLGGLYDPMTGTAIPGKVKAFDEFSENEYASRHKINAILRIGVLIRPARTDYSTASWDGVRESSSGKSGLASFFSDVAVTGTTPALSFIVELRDATGRVLYARAGGLQVVQYLRAEGLAAKFRSIDPKYIMTDPKRDERAFAIAFGPLAGEADTGKAKVELAPAEVPAELAPLRVARSEFFRTYSRLSIAPFAVPPVQQGESVRSRVDGTLRAELQKRGFSIVADDQFAKLWAEEVASSGGFFDPFTGRRDEARWTAARQKVFKKLAADSGASAFLFAAIVKKPAQFQSGQAKWDGVKELVTTSKSWMGTMFNPNAAFIGQLDAFSLEIRVVDVDDRLLFEEYGGMQVAERMSGGSLVPVPEPELFVDPSRDQRAIDLALRPLRPESGGGTR